MTSKQQADYHFFQQCILPHLNTGARAFYEQVQRERDDYNAIWGDDNPKRPFSQDCLEVLTTCAQSFPLYPPLGTSHWSDDQCVFLLNMHKDCAILCAQILRYHARV